MKYLTNSARKIKLLFVTVIIAVMSACNKYTPREGDLLFQDLDCGPLCDAIENVEKGYGNTNISHVGIVVKDNGKWYVAEAYGMVKKTPLYDFINRTLDKNGNPKIIVGRIKEQYRAYTANFKRILDTLYGKPYDDEFRINNGKYYCCELVYEVFADSNGNKLFDLIPMKFSAPASGTPDSVWIEYFKKMNLEVPCNQPGCNPANYSKSDKLEIIAVLGNLHESQ